MFARALQSEHTKDFDADIYNRILGSQAPDILFVSGGSSNQVATTGVSVRDTLKQILPTSRILALADRDDSCLQRSPNGREEGI